MTPDARLARLTDGYVVTQLLWVAAELRIADELAGGPRTAEELAEKVGADAGALRRVLRGLAAEEVFEELPDRRFGLTATSELLREGVEGSQRGAVLARGGLYYGALAGLLDAVRDGGTPFERVHGMTFFQYLDAQPANSARFQGSMAVRAVREAAAVVEAYDFRRFRSLVDVGGGSGVLLREILGAAPQLSATLFDRPEVVRDAQLPAVGGDFFSDVPAGADAYVLSRVIHDWTDDEAVAILRTVRRAIPDTGTLLLVEAVLPERAADDPAAIRMDVHMLTLLGGQERTADEFAALLDVGGFRLDRVLPTGPRSGVHVLVARPV
ncbi:methyltransferase [Pseudonocardia cypriaca]|uniref:Methyltransferase family protein n=1 Tax=Pseudonocardia cypriaca TaxID=882449 RepID=A0A543FUC4_9PSEU|nr:methyltransferase [Pseudonocardia cypriaca]TQM37430.1 methyltransferase family protein [Pseudonocardia cypriaca]